MRSDTRVSQGPSSWKVPPRTPRPPSLLSGPLGSAIGLFWSVVHPLVMLILYTYIFSAILKVRVGAAEGTGGASSTPISLARTVTTRRSMRLRNWRTLPGQG